MVDLERAAAFRQRSCDLNIPVESSSQPIGRAIGAATSKGHDPDAPGLAYADARAARGLHANAARTAVNASDGASDSTLGTQPAAAITIAVVAAKGPYANARKTTIAVATSGDQPKPAVAAGVVIVGPGDYAGFTAHNLHADSEGV